MRPCLFPLLLLFACQGQGVLRAVDEGTTSPTGTSPTTGVGTATGTGTGGACGEVRTWPMTVEGRVVDERGDPVPMADVWVQEHGWHPSITVMGSTVSDDRGFFAIDVPELVDVEDCWGILLNYTVVASAGPLFAERAINPALFAAINDGSFVADIGDLEMWPPATWYGRPEVSSGSGRRLPSAASTGLSGLG